MSRPEKQTNPKSLVKICFVSVLLFVSLFLSHLRKLWEEDGSGPLQACSLSWPRGLANSVQKKIKLQTTNGFLNYHKESKKSRVQNISPDSLAKAEETTLNCLPFRPSPIPHPSGLLLWSVSHPLVSSSSPSTLQNPCKLSCLLKLSFLKNIPNAFLWIADPGLRAQSHGQKLSGAQTG